MWTINEIKEFINNNPINTNGAIEPYPEINPEEINNEDIYYQLIYPLWSQNEQVVKDICNIAIKLANHAYFHNDTNLYFVNNTLEAHCYTHFCDPD